MFNDDGKILFSKTNSFYIELITSEWISSLMDIIISIEDFSIIISGDKIN